MPADAFADMRTGGRQFLRRVGKYAGKISSRKNPKLYTAMLEKGKLEEYLTSYQKSYAQRAEKIFEKLLLKRGISKEEQDRFFVGNKIGMRVKL